MDIENLYVDDQYWVDGYAYNYDVENIPTWANVPVSNILPSYLYQQYLPDDNVNSFFLAYNNTAQEYMDYVVNLNLPIWTSGSILGSLLTWVGTNLYGFPRPVLTFANSGVTQGFYNSVIYNVKPPYNGSVVTGGSGGVVVTDDIYKRCLTWNLYRGDGYQFNARWLKNRILRFLIGVNGVAPYIDNTYNISVTYSQYAITINLNGNYPSQIVAILNAGIQEGVLSVPFQFTYTVIP